MEYIYIFLIGGCLCLIAQLLIDYTNITPAKIMVGYVVLGVLLTAVGVYDKVVEIGKTGATIPIIGFGYSLANGVKAVINESGAIGIISGGLTSTSAGIAAALICAVIMSLIFKPSGK